MSQTRGRARILEAVSAVEGEPSAREVPPAGNLAAGKAPATELAEPREGIPPVVDGAAALAETVAAFAAGTGPTAVDAERASGYRYGQRAFLVQLRREGAGTALIDPVACPDLSSLDAALADSEMVLHAADQDLPCLAGLGLHPRRLFDTELAGRLLGYPKVGLGSLVRAVLGLILEKGHAAVDWSTRPLPETWLRYAALDVEVLIELRAALRLELESTGKLTWAEEEFAAVVAAPPPPPRTDPWRRTSGIHRIRSRRGLAVVRALWEARDRIARHRDLAPTRVLSDAAIVEAGLAVPGSSSELRKLPAFATKSARRHLDAWSSAVTHALRQAESALPEQTHQPEGPPPSSRWAERDPLAAKRLTAARSAIAEIAERHGLPRENLLQPGALRRLVWSPPAELSEQTVAAGLEDHGARPWQIGLVARPLAMALHMSNGSE